MDKNIEVEIRTFISEEKYAELLGYFKNNAEFLGEDDQTTYYFDCPQDLRIQQNSKYSKIWMKKGNIHDDYREELEIKFQPEDFGKLEELFLTLGYSVQIKWFRKRNSFKWEDIDVSLDYTKGYGYIIELEKMSDEAGKEKTFEYLKSKIEGLGIVVTSKEEFFKVYENYKQNWPSLIA